MPVVAVTTRSEIRRKYAEIWGSTPASGWEVGSRGWDDTDLLNSNFQKYNQSRKGAELGKDGCVTGKHTGSSPLNEVVTEKCKAGIYTPQPIVQTDVAQD